MHALNNALGENVFTTQDMEDAARAFLSDNGTGDQLGDHVDPDGNYSSEAMAYALLRARGRCSGRCEMSLREVSPADIERAVGLIQHRESERHWIAYRRWNGTIWRLDSLRESPEQVSYQDLQSELREHRSTFAIYLLP